MNVFARKSLLRSSVHVSDVSRLFFSTWKYPEIRWTRETKIKDYVIPPTSTDEKNHQPDKNSSKDKKYLSQHFFSAWKYPEIRWKRESTKDDESKTASLLDPKQQKFEESVKNAVQRYLEQNYAAEFSLHSLAQTVNLDGKKPKLSQAFQTLAALNGFQKVSIPKPWESVSLAEGIVATPSFYSANFYSPWSQMEPYFLLVQPCLDEACHPTTWAKHPDIIHQDIRIYRLLENRVENMINSVYNPLQNFYTSHIKSPLESFVYGESKERTLKRKREGTLKMKPTDYPETITELELQTSSSRKENLLVVGTDSLVLMSNMTPSVRLLALPYKLGHKSASTLISVFFVLFGAIPLAYRSHNFALNYPGLSDLIAASVIATVCYGIYSSRWMSRTSQSDIISKALVHRIMARDEAVIIVLQEGAVQQVTRSLLSLYYQHLPPPEKQKGDEPDGISREEQDNPRMHLALDWSPAYWKVPKTTTPDKWNSIYSNQQMLVDPKKLAMELGLIEPTDKSTVELTSISMDEVLSHLEQLPK